MSALSQAESDRDAARERLRTTIDELRARVAPKAIVRDVSERGVAIANRYPATLAAGAVAVTLFLVRHRIAALFTRKRRRR